MFPLGSPPASRAFVMIGPGPRSPTVSHARNPCDIREHSGMAGPSEPTAQPGIFATSWRTIALWSLGSALVGIAGSLGALVLVATAKDADALATIALALAVIAFVIQILVFIAQV